jgi:putative ABC transport system permease protein
MFTLTIAAEILWDGRRRYIPGILAIAFALLLVALQCGIFFGLISTVTIPIVESSADVWITYPKTKAGDLARPISTEWREILLSYPEVSAVDEFIQANNYWTTKSAVNDMIVLMGVNPGPESLGPVGRLNPYQRGLLTEEGSVILDVSDKDRLDVAGAGDSGQINRRRVRVVDFVPGMVTLTGSCVVTSLDTARRVLGMPDNMTTFLLVDCKPGVDIELFVAKINESRDIQAWRADDFAAQSMSHWIRKTKAGVAVLFVALLGLGVGAAIASQTLYTATAALMKEFAAIRAMGIPEYRMTSFVIVQSVVMSVIGLAIGIPMAIGLAWVARYLGTEAIMSPVLIFAASLLTLTVGLMAGVIASRSLKAIEPALLLR